MSCSIFSAGLKIEHSAGRGRLTSIARGAIWSGKKSRESNQNRSVTETRYRGRGAAQGRKLKRKSKKDEIWQIRMNQTGRPVRAAASKAAVAVNKAAANKVAAKVAARVAAVKNATAIANARAAVNKAAARAAAAVNRAEASRPADRIPQHHQRRRENFPAVFFASALVWLRPAQCPTYLRRQVSVHAFRRRHSLAFFCGSSDAGENLFGGGLWRRRLRS